MTEKLWPVVREMIKTCIENNQSLIVEGCYIPWDWKKDFTEEEGKSISYLCLIFSRAYLEKNFNLIRKHENSHRTAAMLRARFGRHDFV